MHKNDRRRQQLYRHSRNTGSDWQAPETISVYRPVEEEGRLKELIPPIQDYIQETLERQGIVGVEKISLSSLRLTLLSPRRMSRVRSNQPELSSLHRVQRAIASSLFSEEEPITDIRGNRGVILKGGNNSFAALAFRNARVMAEQRAIYEAIGEQAETLNVPLVGLCTIPCQVPRELAGKLNTGLTSVAPPGDHIDR